MIEEPQSPVEIFISQGADAKIIIYCRRATWAEDLSQVIILAIIRIELTITENKHRTGNKVACAIEHFTFIKK